MTKPEPVWFVTNDKWMRLPGGKLDKNDRRVMRSAGKKVEVINSDKMLDRMQKEEPTEFDAFRKQMAKQKGVVEFTVPELYNLVAQANEKMEHFEFLALMMQASRAWEIRKWRVAEHLTWRSIARRATGNPNQLLGMSLCQRAANMCNEDYLKAPWN